MKFWKDLIDQLWTLLGMFVAWVVLEGSAKDVVGWCILGSLGLWMLTFPLRNRDE
jgi:putative Mn2+ efflux pump MntP